MDETVVLMLWVVIFMIEQVDHFQSQKVVHTDWQKENKHDQQKTGNQTESLVQAVPCMNIRFLGRGGNNDFKA